MLIKFGGSYVVDSMARQPKAKAEAFGEKKTERFQVLFTATGLEQLDALAERLGLSRSDLLERMTRALHATGDEPLIRAFLARGEVNE